MSKTGAAFTVRFLRNGDQVIATRDIINENGDGAGLFQAVDPNTGVVAPDWTVAANQPIIRLGVRSSAGFPAEINSVTWAYAGKTLQFPALTSTFQTATNDDRFAARVNRKYYELRVLKNLASQTVVANQQISYELNYTSNALTDKIRGSVDVLIQAAGADSHLLQITTNRVEIDAVNPTATLTAVGMYGTQNVQIGANGYTIKWYQDGTELTGKTGSTLTVDRSMVTGGSVFVAKLFLDGNAVAQDGQRISDIADEYQITYEPTSAGSNYVGIGHNATYNLSLTKNGSTYSGTPSFAWQIYDAEGNPKTSGTGATVTVKPSDCELSAGGYGDCDVLVTATF